jgi:hypothetical protein
MSAITESAKGKPCTARIPGVCAFDSQTTVWAHIRRIRYGAGAGFKPSDLCGLYACSSCHDVLDRRVKTGHDSEFVELCALQGHLESLIMLEREGIVRYGR